MLSRNGPQNINGINPFCVFPFSGKISPGGDKVIVVQFSPDREWPLFFDVLKISIMNDVCTFLKQNLSTIFHFPFSLNIIHLTLRGNALDNEECILLVALEYLT